MDINIRIHADFAAPFLVGTGALGDTLTNKPTIKNGQQQPIIPASAFKGRARHQCEQLLRALQANERAVCHAPDPAVTCPLDPHWLNDYCPVCQIFGSPKRPSPLTFTDWRWQGRLDAAPTVLRTGVSIQRRRRVAEPQRLYDLEAVDPVGWQYMGHINGRLPDHTAQPLAALLWGGIRSLKTIGGGRGSGLGRVQVQADVRVDGHKVDESWLRDGLTHWRAA